MFIFPKFQTSNMYMITSVIKVNELLPPSEVLSDFYTPSEEQHYRELVFIALSMGFEESCGT